MRLAVVCAVAAVFGLGCTGWFETGISVPESLEVDNRLVRRAERLASALEEPRDAEETCRLVGRAQELERELHQALSTQAQDHPEAIAELSGQLRGLSFEIEDDFTGAVAYGDLAASVTSEEESLLLHATHDLLGVHDPAWRDHSAQDRPCTTLGPTVGPVRGLADTWRRAPECLTEALTPPLKASLDEMSRQHCFCSDPETTRAEFDALEGALRRLTALEGDQVAKALEETLTHPETHYESDCAP